MKRLLLLVSAFLVASCASDSTRVVDGGRVDAEGWPLRPSEATFRCPRGTYLVDEIVGASRRRVTCRTRLNPAPRGFELVWQANGQLASVRLFDDQGRPVSLVRYDPTGEKRAEEEWIDGRQVLARSWYPTGEIRSELEFLAERGVTRVSRWAPDGTIEAEGELLEGKREGPWTEWVEGATERAVYTAGRRSGGVTRVYPDDSVETGSYSGGLRDGLWRRVGQSGSPIREARYDEGLLDGIFRTWHPNQQLKSEGRYQNGQKHGSWSYWHASGELAGSEHYRCGVLHGRYATFTSSGEPTQLGLYWEGEKIGEWRRWTEDGELSELESHPIPETLDDPEEIRRLREGKTTPEVPETCPLPVEDPT